MSSFKSSMRTNAPVLALFLGVSLWIALKPYNSGGLVLELDAHGLALQADDLLVLDGGIEAVVSEAEEIAHGDRTMTRARVFGYASELPARPQYVAAPQRIAIHDVIRETMLSPVMAYLQSDGKNLALALFRTLCLAALVSLAILAISFLLSGLAWRLPKWSVPLDLVVLAFCVVPTVYLIFLIQSSINLDFLPKHMALIGFLVFSNMILFYFYKQYQDDLFQELSRQYHAMSRQLGVANLFESAWKKVLVISLHRFRSLFIVVFSSTVFVEYKLRSSRGIYSYFYQTIFFDGDPARFWGQLLIILTAVIAFLLAYQALVERLSGRLA